MIDAQKLSNWYDFQAPFYRLWRDDYDGPLVQSVHALLGLPSAVAAQCLPSAVAAQCREPTPSTANGKPFRLLDAGCGTGMFSLGLAKREAELEIEGLDASEGMLQVARRQAEQLGLRNVRFARGDVTALSRGDGSFDAVVAAGLFPNINDTAAALREFWRVLTPGGRLIVVEFDRVSMGWSQRAFFNVMISGYRLVSLLVPRFRFAEGWSIDQSTIDRPRFESELRAVGFAERELMRGHNHLIFHYVKDRAGRERAKGLS